MSGSWQPPGSPPPPYGQQPGGYQQGYPPPPPVQQAGTNGLAIASLVMGIAQLVISFIGTILALVFGYIAKKQIRETGQAGAGMATAGIVLGWIGLALGILFVILIVSLSNSSTDF